MASQVTAPTPPTGIYPAKLHASLVFKHLLSSAGQQHRHIIYLEGNQTTTRDDSDRELAFHQEANFAYLSGCRNIPGARLVVEKVVGAGDGEKGVKSTLFVPEVDEDSVMWSGLPPTPSELLKSLDVDSVLELPQLSSYLTQLSTASSSSVLLHHLPQTPAPVPTLAATTSHLLPSLHLSRRHKTPFELSIMRYANHLSSRAHDHLMRLSSPSSPSSVRITSEPEGEAEFVRACMSKGARTQAYESIVAVGENAGTLHYLGNDKEFGVGEGKEGRVVLVDAGCEWDGYASDITRTFPVGNGGKFTKEGKDIYTLVLKMQEAALAEIKPGASWEGIQLLMHKVAAEGLLSLGILRHPSSSSDPAAAVKDLVEKNVTVGFFPHGIGHMLGLDTHDVGGLPEGRSKDPRIRYLRLRLPLEEGFVVTVEPGLYFNQFLLKDVKGSEWIDKEVLEKYMSVGGVRIEDNVVVTKNGFDNLTTAVKSVEEVEKLCQKGIGQ